MLQTKVSARLATYHSTNGSVPVSAALVITAEGRSSSRIELPLNLEQLGLLIAGQDVKNLKMEGINLEGFAVAYEQKTTKVRLKQKVEAARHREVAERLGQKREVDGWVWRKDLLSFSCFAKDKEGYYVVLHFDRELGQPQMKTLPSPKPQKAKKTKVPEPKGKAGKSLSGLIKGMSK